MALRLKNWAIFRLSWKQSPNKQNGEKYGYIQKTRCEGDMDKRRRKS